jgi:phosphate:Na+ symporter
MSTFLYILGSLGLFLYGMKIMSEGLQKVSGRKLRGLVEDLTRTPLRGVVSGAVMTTIVQSSSASTVIMISFVNAGLLKLKQAISMIMGANLGTTTTFWLIALIGFKFNLSAIALPAIGVGVICIFFRKTKVREVGETLIGFGILFLGLNLLKDSVPDVETNIELFQMLEGLGAYGFWSILLFFFFGIILTIAVQSSSVAGAITLTLVAKGWIDYELAAAIVLGENVGTTITANLAAMTGNVESKRAARAHLLFNLIGVVWMLPIFVFFIQFVDFLGGLISLNDRGGIQVRLAIFHTLFNVFNTILLIKFIPQLAAIATRMAPKGTEKSRYVSSFPSYGGNLPKTGELLLAEARKGVSELSRLTNAMFNTFLEIYAAPEEKLQENIQTLKMMEEQSQELCDDVSAMLIQCASQEISDKRTNEITALFRVISELKAVTNCCHKLGKLAYLKYKKKRVLPEETQAALANFGQMVDQFLSFQTRQITQSITPAVMESAHQLEDQVDRSRKRMRKEAVQRMKDPANIKSEMLFIDIINTIERIGDHCLNILRILRSRDL